MVKRIKTVAEAKKLKFGDQYIIDVYPDDPADITDEHIEIAAKIKEVANVAAP